VANILGADKTVTHNLTGKDLDVITSKTDGYSAGLYNLNAVLTHSLKASWFQPLSLSRENLGFNVCFPQMRPLAPLQLGVGHETPGGAPVHVESSRPVALASAPTLVW
jgi:hypothetical protein